MKTPFNLSWNTGNSPQEKTLEPLNNRFDSNGEEHLKFRK